MAEETGTGAPRPGDNPKNKGGVPQKSDNKLPEAEKVKSPSGDNDDQRAAAVRKGADNDEYQGAAPLTELKEVKTTDSVGNEITVPAGVDGKTPVSPQNPSPRAVSNPDAEYFQTPPPNES